MIENEDLSDKGYQAFRKMNFIGNIILKTKTVYIRSHQDFFCN